MESKATRDNRIYMGTLLILLQSLLYGFGDPISKAAYDTIGDRKSVV